MHYVITKESQASQGNTFVITKVCGAITFVITRGWPWGDGGSLCMYNATKHFLTKIS